MSFFQVVLCLLASMALALPHDQMVNNEFIRDVGVLYPNSNFSGDPMYLVMYKQVPKCLQIDPVFRDFNVASTQICIPATCIIYKTPDCTISDSEDGDAYYFQGPVDVDDLPGLNIAQGCESYECGSIEAMAGKIGNSAAMADSQGGCFGVVMRQ